jgi:hypothetical protein
VAFMSLGLAFFLIPSRTQYACGGRLAIPDSSSSSIRLLRLIYVSSYSYSCGCGRLGGCERYSPHTKLSHSLTSLVLYAFGVQRW